MLAVADEVGIDELGAVVGVDALEPEGERLPHRLQRLLHRVLPPAQDRPRLHPGGVDVREVQGVRELPVARVAAVGHQVDLGEAGDGDVPPIGSQRNVLLQERPRLRAPVAPGLAGPPGGRQPSVHLAGTQAEQLRLDRRAEPEAGARPREPEGEQRFEADRPGIPGSPPDRRQHLDHPEPVCRRPPPGHRGAPGGQWAVEEAQGRLPVVAGHPAELIEHPLLLGSTGRLVAGVDRFQVLPSPLSTHGRYPPSMAVWEGNISNGATMDLSVTF